ncbi:GNAT family N-acetyltransferase [Streptomyces durbertensis]|uniref:GNAT family N-acetyltransferase n=1 Tax=Streptomyces durbertensis TaxID=2448886 RepID=A0ABR6EKG2_9ACTN|nr:GNAT family N-acetyltransferase [Streptomyces durbertensis]MBB1245824.1 GNAT family N-acetyltransferase [Streptomyces durbertensis]
MELRMYTREDAAGVREMLLDMHESVHDGGSDRFRARERFAWFVDRWSGKESWSCVIGFDEGEPAGFAYGAAFGRGGWWKGSERPASIPPMESVFALSELLVVEKWRKTGLSDALHEALVDSRGDDVATLLVDVTHPKVLALYESWGYTKVDEQKPFEDSPVFAVMVKRLVGLP